MAKGANLVLIIGAGIAGIQAALDLANMGIKVHVIEKRPCIGGRMAQLDKTFPTNDCSICILAPKLSEAARHPNIILHTLSEVVGLKGTAGNFNAKIVEYPRYVNLDKCINCGDCIEKCPTRVDDDFNAGLKKRRAIYLDYLQGIPAKVTIDPQHCLFITRGKCGICKKVCKKEAIEYDQKEKNINLPVSSVIVATGYDLFDPTPLVRYGYGKIQNVITAIELERLECASGPTDGHLQRPSDKKAPKKLGIIQCVGSRDKNFNNYCSSICCMYATKEAMIAHEHDNEIETKIFYIDLRAGGKNFREYLERGEQEYNISYVNGKVAEIREDKDKNPILIYEDINKGKVLTETFDLVVLATSVVPRKDVDKIADALGLERNEYNFIKTLPGVPIKTTKAGIFACGSCHEPMDIPSSVVEASGAAALAAEIIRKSR